jgi:aquaporin TIP
VDADAYRRGAAEFVGAFTLIFAGGGAVLAGGSLVDVAFAHGLAIAVMVSAVGHISGGHFNPAVTFGFLVTRRIAPALAGLYWTTQLAGAVLAALLLRWIFGGDASVASAPSAPDISDFKGFAIEAILTFFLVWVVFATAVDPRGTYKSVAGLAIGLTIAMDAFMGGPLTGAAMNPARAFGPELVNGFWGEGWIYYAGPLLGAAAAALAYERMYLRPLAPAVVGWPETGIEEPRPGDAAVS